MSDEWIRELARQHREEDALSRQMAEELRAESAARLTKIRAALPRLWSELRHAVEERAESYNAELGKQAIFVEGQPDSLRLRYHRHSSAVVITTLFNDDTGILTGSIETKSSTGGSSSVAMAGGPLIEILSDGQVSLEWTSLSSGETEPISPDEAATRLTRLLFESMATTIPSTGRT